MRISVALCTFNGQAYLPRQLQSLVDQDRRPDELIVFDDDSSDQTAAIIRRFAESAPFEVRWQINPDNLGVSRNFQSAIAAATGDAIACCDQDDVWYPEKLAEIEAAFLREQVDLVFSDAHLVDEELRPIGPRLWESIGFGRRRQRLAQNGRLWSVQARFNAVTGAGMAFASHWRNLLLPIPDGWTHDGWIGTLLSVVGRCRLTSSPLWAYRCHADQQIGPGPAKVADAIERARQMDRAYFQGLQANFTAVVQRLAEKSIDLTIVRRLRDKIIHCRNRAEMRTIDAVWPGLVAEELFSGRYCTCGLGWKSLAQDVCFARVV